MPPKFFNYKYGRLRLPVFFPDATRGFVKTLDFVDVENTSTPGVLVNTFHLWQLLDRKVLERPGGIRKFMSWKGAAISDSGGFQVMSVIKKGIFPGRITDEGIILNPARSKRLLFSPEESIRFQMSLGTDMVVALDDFTDPSADYEKAKESVERTVNWALRSKAEFEKICKDRKISVAKRPYLLGVVQGGEFMELRKECTKRLVEIGFDGLGWGGWPIVNGKLNFRSAEIIAENSPKDYLLYGLGIGKPEDIIACYKLGFTIFDCVLPTRDGRHARLYTFNSDSADKIKITGNFYSFYDAKKEKNRTDNSKISEYCDCVLCKKYSRAYLYHLFKVGDLTAMRLSSIHNLRFYSLLMTKLREG